MNEQEPHDRDHWDIYAACMDLTIEGHRLIAEELMFEIKSLWSVVTHWVHDLPAVAARLLPVKRA